MPLAPNLLMVLAYIDLITFLSCFHILLYFDHHCGHKCTLSMDWIKLLQFTLKNKHLILK